MNSKATLRVPLPQLKLHVPALIFSELSESRYYAHRSDSLVIQADSSRKQADNVEGAYVKLHEIFRQAARSVVKGETAPEKVAKVKEL